MTIALKGHTGQVGVGNYLGKTGDVKLSELNTTDSTTRTFTNASTDYKRVNAHEIAEDDAPTESDADTSPEGTGAANSLIKWDGYVQWDTDANKGIDFKLTGGKANGDCSAGNNCTATFTWTRPTNYGDFPHATVQQTLWVTPCSPNTQIGCENDDPFDGTVDDDRHVITDNSPTGTQAQASGLDDETWHIAAVRMEWNDEDTSDNPYKQTGEGYTLHSSPGGDGTCSVCADGGPAIVFETGEFIPCTTVTPGLSTQSGNTGACESCQNWNDNGGGLGGVRTTVQVNHSGFLSGKILYTNGQSCASGQEITHKWASNDGMTAYTIQTAGSGIAGRIYTPTVNCQDTEICDGGA